MIASSLIGLLHIIGGTRSCVWIPAPGVPPHHFRSTAAATSDGRFIIEHDFNRGISEVIVFGFDATRRRYIRTRLAQDGSYDVAVSPGIRDGTSIWTSLNAGTRTAISAVRSGSYAFRVLDTPGKGSCSGPL